MLQTIKTLSLFTISFFIATFLTISAIQAAEGSLTKGKFAEVIINNTDLQLPEASHLSDPTELRHVEPELPTSEAK